MTPSTATGLTASDDELAQLLGLIKDSDSVELKLTVPESHQRSTVAALGHGSARGADPPGLLLRHARPRARQARRRRARPPDPGQGRRLGREAAAGRAGRAAGRAAPVGELQRRGRRAARRLRLLGDDEGRARPERRQSAARRRAAAAQALLEGAARVLRRRTRPRASELDDLVDPRARSSCSSSRSRRRSSAAGSSPRCGSTPTARACSSSRRGARTAEAFQVAAEARAFLAGRGVDLSGEQQTKTRKALEYFAKALRRREGHAERRLARSRRSCPRWEWRTFGDDFGDAEDRLGALDTRARRRRATRSTCSRSRATPRSRCATG